MNKKISELTDGGALGAGDIVPIVRTGVNFKATYAGGGGGASLQLHPPGASKPLASWVRADAVAIVGDGNEVTYLADASGRAIAWAPAATGPLYIQNGIGGKPTLRFAAGKTMISDANFKVTANAHTGFMVFKSNPPALGSQRNIFSFKSDNYFMIQHLGSGPLDLGLYGISGGPQGWMWFPEGVAAILTWISTATGIIFRVNGVSIYDGVGNRQLSPVGPAADLAATQISIGSICNNQFNQSAPGDVSELICYDGVLDLDEIRAVEAYLAARYSLTVTENLSQTKRAVAIGDSRFTPVNPNQGAGASTLSSLRSHLGFDWFAVCAAISGDTVEDISAAYPIIAAQFFDSGLAKNVAVVWVGVNNLTNDQTAANIYAALLVLCAKARATGFLVVLCNEPDCSALSGPQATQRAALNVLIAATAVPGTVDALCDIAAVAGTLSNVHPTAAQGIPIATAMAASVAGL